MNTQRGLLLVVCLWAGASFAKDFGVLGTTWPVTEVDVRKLMAEDAARTDWTPAQDALKDSAKNYVDNLPKRRLLSPDQSQTLWVDPSIVLGSDIQAPVKQPDGSYSWKILVPKGTLVNPLVQFRPVTAFLLFDGSDELQLALVKKVLEKEPLRIVPVEAGAGSINKSNDALRRPVFYANDGMMNRFKVQYLPSLVYPGFGPRELYLGTTSFALPYKVDEVLQTWPSLGFTPKTTGKGLK